MPGDLHTPCPLNPTSGGSDIPAQLLTQHPRLWRDFHYVYPVISRRSKGLSIGINLNIDKACNFDCLYCCVNRTLPPPRRDVDLDQLQQELAAMLQMVWTGLIWTQPPLDQTPAHLRRLNDIAFSGDGEPSLFPQLDQAVRHAADLKNQLGLDHVKLILVTNATGLDRPATRRALALLDQNNGQVWAKLDAGTEDYYRLVNRTSFPFQKLLTNILTCGRERPIVIQSLFIRIDGRGPSQQEFQAYLDRLAYLHAHGCQIQLVQLYTLARPPAYPSAQPLSRAELDALARQFTASLPHLPMECYYGPDEPLPARTAESPQ